MLSPGLLHREERIAIIIKVARIGELGTMCFDCQLQLKLFLSSLILVTLMMEAIHSSETSVPRTTTQHNIPEDGILHSRLRETLNLT
jgi:hypothetical protein